MPRAHMFRNDVIILCGGQGTRLREIFSDPKILFPLDGKPFLSHLYNQIRELTSGKIILCTGYKSTKIEAFCTDNDLDVVISRENRPAGTGGAVLNALAHISTNYFICVNGDTLLSDSDFRNLFEICEKKDLQKNIILACKTMQWDPRYGCVNLEPTLQIKKITDQKAETIDAFSGLSAIKKDILNSTEFGSISFENLIARLKIPKLNAQKMYLSDEFYDYGTVDAASRINEKVNIT